jgi:putative intracellular protease/amidase
VKIAYVLYPDFTALDLVGPYEVISRWPDAEVRFLATSLEPVRPPLRAHARTRRRAAELRGR